jgi:uncharacterized protein (DUF1697 family)
MNTFVVLIRGINVGGKNKISMAELKSYLETLGYLNVITYIASGNVILQSMKSSREIKDEIEETLPTSFKFDSKLIKVLVLAADKLEAIVEDRPEGFGEQPDKYHSDAIFLMDLNVTDALEVFDPREGVDTIWSGQNVIYSQRLSALRTKSRLNKVMGTTAYKSMTIRSWNTTVKLLEIVKGLE